MPETNDRDIDLTNDNEDLELENDQETDDNQSDDDSTGDDDSSDSMEGKSELEQLRAELGRTKRDLKKAQRNKSKKSSSSSLSADEVRLLARHDDDAMEQIRKIAKIEDVSLTEAEKTDYFDIWKDKRERVRLAEQASLDATKGGQSKSKNFKTPGLDREDHKQLWARQTGN